MGCIFSSKHKLFSKENNKFQKLISYEEYNFDNKQEKSNKHNNYTYDEIQLIERKISNLNYRIENIELECKLQKQILLSNNM
jgi:hypothetical protein